MTKRRNNPFLRRTRADGEIEYRCNICHEWKPPTEYYAETNNRSQHGLKSRCKPCHNAKTRAWQELNRDKRAEYAATRRRKFKSVRTKPYADIKTSADSAHIEIPIDRALPLVAKWLNRLDIDPMNRSVIADRTGVPERTWYRILTPGVACSVHLSTLDKLAVAADGQADLAELLNELVPIDEKPNWAPYHKHTHCLECGTTSVPHWAKGMCRRCYQMAIKGKSRAEYAQKWAPYHGHDCCRVCSTNERPHVARGLCGRCYDKHMYRFRRGPLPTPQSESDQSNQRTNT